MKRKIDLMSRNVVSLAINFSLAFFIWLHRQLIRIDDYPYVGVDFRDDPEFVLPEGEKWDATGKIF